MNKFLLILKFEVIKILKDKKMLLFPLIMGILSLMFSSFMGNNSSENKSFDGIVYYNSNELSEKYMDIIEKNLNISMVSNDNLSKEYMSNANNLEMNNIYLLFENKSITIYYNSENKEAKEIYMYISSLLNKSNTHELISKIANEENFSLKEINLNTGKKINNKYAITMIPYLLTLLLFSNATAFSLSAIAGEKEIGVYYKNMSTPVKGSIIISAKMVAASFLSFMSSMIYYAVIFVAKLLSNNIEAINNNLLANLNLSIVEALILLAYAILLALIFALISVIASLIAKDTKGAKSFLIPFQAIVTAMAFFSTLNFGMNEDVSYFVPIYNVCIIFQDIMSGRLIANNMYFTLISLAVLLLMLIWLSKKALKKSLSE